MTLTDADRVIIETRVANEGPSPVVAYGLWFFLGVFGAHRFYLGRPVSALAQLVLCLLVVGIVWWVIDLALIPGMIREKRAELRSDLLDNAYAAQPATGPRRRWR